MKNVSLKALVAVLLVSLFSGCGKEPIVSYDGCPELEIYEIPEKILIKGEYLGKTNLYRDNNFTKMLGETDIISTLEGMSISYDKAILMPMDLLLDIIDYVTTLREGAEAYEIKRLEAKKRKEELEL